MVITKGAASGDTLTRTLATSIIAGLGGDDQPLCDMGPDLRDAGDGHDDIDGGLGAGTASGGAGNGSVNDGEVEGRCGPRAVPLFNIFRPF